MKNIESQFFVPHEESDVTAVLPVHLGASIDDEVAFNAQFIANTLGINVLAYNRRGTGPSIHNLGLHQELHPSRIAQSLAHTGLELANTLDATDTKHVILGGHSAAASESIGIANAQTLPFQTMAVSDPVGLRPMRFLPGVGTWAYYQAITQRNSPEKNQNPSPIKPDQWTLVGRTAIDMLNYGRYWRSTAPLDGLGRLASDPDFADKTVGVLFVEHTFSHKSRDLQNIADELNALRPLNAPQPFVATVAERMHHDYFDDPAHIAGLLLRTLLLRRPADQDC